MFSPRWVFEDTSPKKTCLPLWLGAYTRPLRTDAPGNRRRNRRSSYVKIDYASLYSQVAGLYTAQPTACKQGTLAKGRELAQRSRPVQPDSSKTHAAFDETTLSPPQRSVKFLRISTGELRFGGEKHQPPRAVLLPASNSENQQQKPSAKKTRKKSLTHWVSETRLTGPASGGRFAPRSLKTESHNPREITRVPVAPPELPTRR